MNIYFVLSLVLLGLLITCGVLMAYKGYLVLKFGFCWFLASLLGPVSFPVYYMLFLSYLNDDSLFGEYCFVYKKLIVSTIYVTLIFVSWLVSTIAMYYNIKNGDYKNYNIIFYGYIFYSDLVLSVIYFTIIYFMNRKNKNRCLL
ncbi:MAG: hypothetical protein LKI53_03320 [Bacteroidales bacterium]|jgi:sensor histidine kinase YesM|nr:hypothetical protein [Bacteroidales bacterium]